MYNTQLYEKVVICNTMSMYRMKINTKLNSCDLAEKDQIYRFKYQQML